jgi:hypothetical protein
MLKRKKGTEFSKVEKVTFVPSLILSELLQNKYFKSKIDIQLMKTIVFLLDKMVTSVALKLTNAYLSFL